MPQNVNPSFRVYSYVGGIDALGYERVFNIYRLIDGTFNIVPEIYQRGEQIHISGHIVTEDTARKYLQAILQCGIYTAQLILRRTVEAIKCKPTGMSRGLPKRHYLQKGDEIDGKNIVITVTGFGESGEPLLSYILGDTAELQHYDEENDTWLPIEYDFEGTAETNKQFGHMYWEIEE